MPTPTEVTKAWIDAMERHDFAAADALVADEAVFAGPVPEPFPKDAFMGLHQALIAAMPDWSFDAQDFRDDGDRAHFSVAVGGTFTEELHLPALGVEHVAPNGKAGRNLREPVTATIRDGKVVRIDVEPVEGAGVPGLLRTVGVELPAHA
jgi:hypothetical protein